ncbi:hypothetical protein VAH18_003504 [Providencia rettgeri]|nr:hypothetical protein [Providencia rettgeri]
MSMYDPIDQNTLKQVVLADFFNFHLKKDEVWAVLNAKSVLFASDLFLLTGIEQSLYDVFSSSFAELVSSDFTVITSRKSYFIFPLIFSF